MQVTNTLSLQPEVSFAFLHGSFQTAKTNTDDDLTTATTRFVLPLSAAIRWSASRNWDLDLQYTYYEIGYQNGFTEQDTNLSATYFW